MIRTEGLFRVAGFPSVVDDLKRKFDDGTFLSLAKSASAWFTGAPGKQPDLSGVPAHALAGLFKAYFRELPDALFPCDDYHRTLGKLSLSLSTYMSTYSSILIQPTDVLRDAGLGAPSPAGPVQLSQLTIVITFLPPANRCAVTFADYLRLIAL
jgi:hypothetical protein